MSSQSPERVIFAKSSKIRVVTSGLPEYPQLPRPYDSFGAALDLELFVEPGDVSLHRVGRNVELAGDLLVGAAGGEMLQHLEFALADAKRGLRPGVGFERRRRRPPEQLGSHPYTDPHKYERDQREIKLNGMGSREVLEFEPLQEYGPG